MLERLGTLRFDAAVMLNLSPDHLDRHGDMAGYAAAKRAIFDRQASGDLAVVGIDDADSRAMARTCRHHRVRRAPADVWCEAACCATPPADHADGRGAALPGAHNAQNAAAAAAVATHLGVSRASDRDGHRSFPGLPHRQQRVATVDGVRYVDDSKATNADAAARALACYDRIVWIAGGIAKAGGIAPLRRCFPASPTRC